MQTRDELLNGLSEAVSIIRNLGNIQYKLNQVRGQYQRILPHKKMSKRNIKFWIILIPLWTMGLMAEFGSLVGIIYAVINIGLILLYYASKNKKIDAKNKIASANNEKIMIQEQAVLNDLQQVQIVYRERLSSWYPDSYCSVDAVEFFYNSVKNYRADSIKEAINLYETVLHQQRVEASQQQAVQQQKLNNLLSVGSLVMQGAALGEMSRQNARQTFAMQEANRTLDDIRTRLH